jgi:8-oxo-dGTP pyrophosphatase MutT (NUDIX family)
VYGISKTDASETGIILTRRSKNLVNHAGQWALPGGSVDHGETAEQTALRELKEEVNLRLDDDAILGKLDDFHTRSGYSITPVVIWAGENLKLRANPAEVSAIHRIPLAEFMREDAPILESIPESDEPVLLMPVGTGWIATPTGAILYQFREVALKGRNIRVSHYEQPYFAWQ